MHRILFEALLLFMLSSCLISSLGTASTSVSATERSKLSQVSLSQNIVYQHQNVTHNGDLIISNNEALTITDSTFYMNGTITVKDASNLTITNSNFTAAPRDRYAIILKDNASLIITNTTLIFRSLSDICEIQAKTNSKIMMSDSRTQNQGYLVAFNNSEVYVSNSTLFNGTVSNFLSNPSGVAAFGNSTTIIENSTINGIFVWNDSTASVNNSNLGIIRTGYEPSARTTINVTHSKINWIEILGGSSDLYIEDSLVNGASASSGRVTFLRSSLEELNSWETSEMTFIDSSYGTISASEGASVFVGWHLPLLGLLVIPYTWIAIIQVGTALIAIAAIIIVFFAWRRKRRQNQEQHSVTNKVAEP